MKKFIKIILCTVFVCTLSACSKSKEVIQPMKITSSFLDAYLARNSEDIKLYSEWSEDSIKLLELQDDDYIDGVDKALQVDIYNMMYGFDHKEIKENINEDSATVTCEFMLYDFAPTFKKGITEATKKVEELSSKSNISDKQSQQEIMKVLFTNLKESKKTNKTTLDIHLKKTEKGWIVTNDNDSLQKALAKNAQEIIQNT